MIAACVLTAITPVKTAASVSSNIHLLEIKGAIVPVTADYINRGIQIAEDNNAICIIQMNTPGGLGTAMQDIVQRIINARVPIIVYVVPGGWAASAGTFISMSAHLSAMGPGSTIGAASPVAGSGEELPETAKQKAIEFYQSYMAALAELRDHNVDWARRAVTESIAASAQEAYNENVIDILADDIYHLIAQLDGRTVKLSDGQPGSTVIEVTLQTSDYTTTNIAMNFVERFLLAISDSNIAYILLGLAMLGIFLELSNPGTIFPGVFGGICLFISLYALAMLSAQWSGILLIVLAAVLFVLEAFVTSGGILTAGGAAALIAGSLVLFGSHPAIFRINPWLIGIVVAIVTVFFAFLVTSIIRAHHRQPETGWEGLINKIAVVKNTLDPQGLIFVRGEYWNATTDGEKIEEGEKVIVTKVDGLKLWVTKIK